MINVLERHFRFSFHLVLLCSVAFSVPFLSFSFLEAIVKTWSLSVKKKSFFKKKSSKNNQQMASFTGFYRNIDTSVPGYVWGFLFQPVSWFDVFFVLKLNEGQRCRPDRFPPPKKKRKKKERKDVDFLPTSWKNEPFRKIRARARGTVTALTAHHPP